MGAIAPTRHPDSAPGYETSLNKVVGNGIGLMTVHNLKSFSYLSPFLVILYDDNNNGGGGSKVKIK